MARERSPERWLQCRPSLRIETFTTAGKTFNTEDTGVHRYFSFSLPSTSLLLFFSSRRLRLFPFLFRRQWSVHLQQAFGQFHVDPLLLNIYPVEIGLGERYFHSLGLSVPDD